MGPDLDLSQGAVSSSLLTAAGPAIQQECRTQVPAGQQIATGQIIRTAGHQLHCKDVLHGSCMKWDAGAGKCEEVGQILSMCVVVSVTEQSRSSSDIYSPGARTRKSEFVQPTLHLRFDLTGC